MGRSDSQTGPRRDQPPAPRRAVRPREAVLAGESRGLRPVARSDRIGFHPFHSAQRARHLHRNVPGTENAHSESFHRILFWDKNTEKNGTPHRSRNDFPTPCGRMREIRIFRYLCEKHNPSLHEKNRVYWSAAVRDTSGRTPPWNSSMPATTWSSSITFRTATSAPSRACAASRARRFPSSRWTAATAKPSARSSNSTNSTR